MHTLRHYINLIKESELVEPEITVKLVQNVDTSKLSDKWLKGVDDPDSGMFARARELNPHQISLISYKMVDKDPKLAYIYSVKDLMGSNPYVPIVYKIKLVKHTSTGQVKPTYIMQKLINYKDIPILNLFTACKPVMESMIEVNKKPATPSTIRFYQNLKDRYEKVVQDIMAGQEDPIGKEGHWTGNNVDTFKHQTIELTINILRDLFKNKLSTNDDNLNAVMSIIRELESNNSFNYDLHKNNIMFRQSSSGYQLVITDPLS